MRIIFASVIFYRKVTVRALPGPGRRTGCVKLIVNYDFCYMSASSFRRVDITRWSDPSTGSIFQTGPFLLHKFDARVAG